MNRLGWEFNIFIFNVYQEIRGIYSSYGSEVICINSQIRTDGGARGHELETSNFLWLMSRISFIFVPNFIIFLQSVPAVHSITEEAEEEVVIVSEALEWKQFLGKTRKRKANKADIF